MIHSEETSLDVKKEIFEWVGRKKRLPPWFWKFCFRFFLCLGVCTAVFVVIVLIGMYRMAWDGTITRTISTFLDAPVVTVNNHWITARQYFQERHAVEGFYKTLPNNERLGVSQLDTLVLDALVEKEIISQLAREYTVEVSDKEIRFRTQTIFGGLLDQPAVLEKILIESYGFSLEAYQNTIILPLLKKEKLEEKIFTDERISIRTLQELIEKFKEEHTIRIFLKSRGEK